MEPRRLDDIIGAGPEARFVEREMSEAAPTGGLADDPAPLANGASGEEICRAHFTLTKRRGK